MAQYWLEVTGAADISAFTTVGLIGLAFETVDTLPALRITPGAGDGTNGGHAYVTALAASATVDMLVKIKANSTTTDARIAGIGARLSGSSGTTNTGYGLGRYGSTSKRCYSIINNAATNLSTATGGGTNSQFHWMRLHCSGTTIQWRSWNGALGDEPATWTASVTDSSIAAAGLVGLMRHQTTSDGVRDAWINTLSIGTDGDPAPTGPVGGRQRSRLILTPW